MNDNLITVDCVYKKFCKSLGKSMRYGIEDITKALLGLGHNGKTLRTEEFWAVNNVSFTLRRGECMGLIGPNGSGKSTLLKMLNGIFMPDMGIIKIRGRVGALIELGAGFHPMLTGRENIYVNGAILGFSKKDIDQKFDSIVEFSELKDFIDSPVKHYSSGMHVRLGFAIAAHMEPDVVLIDEVLAVGDAGFRAKCYDAIYSMLRNAAIIFVSHNMAHINRMCTSVILMNKGISQYFNNSGEAVSAYLSLADGAGIKSMEYSNGKAAIENLVVKGRGGQSDICTGEPFDISFELWLSPEIASGSIYVYVLSREQIPVAATKHTIEQSLPSAGRYRIHFYSPRLSLAPEKYSLSISLFDNASLSQIFWYHQVAPFKVQGSEFLGSPTLLLGSWETSSGNDTKAIK